MIKFDIAIEDKILTILKEKLGCNEELLDKKNRHAILTWEPFNFSAVQLIYLLLEIEKVIGIRIPEKFLHDYEFNTIEKIISIVNECVNYNN